MAPCGEELDGLAKAINTLATDEISYRVLSHECLRHNDRDSCEAANRIKSALDDDETTVDNSIRDLAKCIPKNKMRAEDEE